MSPSDTVQSMFVNTRRDLAVFRHSSRAVVRLARRNILFHRKRSGLIVLALTLGVAAGSVVPTLQARR